MRRPLVTNGERGSFGTAFLLTVMWARVERGIGILAGDVLVDQVEQEHVVLGAAGDDLVAALGQAARHQLRHWP